MPEMDGLDLIRLIRASKRRGYVYIILLTARSEKQDLVQGMEAGADDFMIKPPDEDELRVRLRAGERIIHLEERLEATEPCATPRPPWCRTRSWPAWDGWPRVWPMRSTIRWPTSPTTSPSSAATCGRARSPRRLPPRRHGGSPDLLPAARRLEKETDLAYFRDTFGRTCDKSLEGLQRVRDIVGDLRDFARLDEAELKEADLNAAVATAAEVLGHEMHHKKIRLERDLRPLPPVLCHPAKVNQVFLNLMVNAVQACDPGGTVSLRSRVEEGRGVAVEVEDNGCGIPVEHRPRLFEPFFTTRPIGQGTGLGLAVSFGIVRDHGGSIEVDSSVGRGSTFRVRLPLRPPTPPTAPASEAFP